MIDISIIVPTYNERKNLPIIVGQIQNALSAYSFEIIVVDDNSPDGTSDVAREIAGRDSRVVPICRINQKGLSSAIFDGFTIAKGKYAVVIDSDLQHDVEALPKFLNQFEAGSDIVVGTRKADGGNIENWSKSRKFVSWAAGLISRLVIPGVISDPMSGYFGVRKEFFLEIKDELNPRGFKLLLNILYLAKNREISEVGYTFKPRIHGESKLDSKVMVSYVLSLYELRFGKYISVRFIKYILVGLSGVIVNQSGLWFGKNILLLEDSYALIIGIDLSIISNFFLNNAWTFRNQQLKGPANIAIGLAKFHFVSIVGALINYSIALFISENFFDIYLANLLGIIFATMWNYLNNVYITWKAVKD